MYKISVICISLLLLASGIAFAAQEQNEANLSIRKATDYERDRIISAVKEILIEPNSAQFFRIFIVNNDVACVGVNARNKHGKYEGLKQSIVRKKENKWISIGVFNLFELECISRAKTFHIEKQEN